MTRRSLSARERLRLFQLHGEPLSDTERRRGCHLPAARLAEIEAECLRLIREGASQDIIRTLLGASRSRVSRWCISAVTQGGSHDDHRRLRGRGRTLTQRIFDRIEFDQPDKCWWWRGSLKGNGYGGFRHGDADTNAHRAVYELFIGPIPNGMQIDHKCVNPGCVNPRHLQTVWPSENQTLASARRDGGDA